MPGFQGFCFAKEGRFMKVLRGFVLCLYCLMLAITGVSFLMGSTCKAAISDIVVYKSEDKITDAIASVYPNLKGDELDKVFDYLENDKDLRKIAETKMPDLNAYTIEAAMKIIEGTARNMGIAVEGINDEELKEQALEAKEAEIAEAKREAALEKMEESANNNNAEVEVIGENKETEEN